MSGVDRPSGTVSFLFTDVEGSTPLWDRFPDAMGAALARHDEIIRSTIESHGGYVFSTHGDEFAAAFGRAGDAVTAALAAQRGLAAEAWQDALALRVRMGVHTGEADERDGDFFGPVVNRAARIMGVANGGQVVVSELTAGLLEQSPGMEFIDLGRVELKGVLEPVHVFGVAGDGHEWLDVPLLIGDVGRGNLPQLLTESVGDLTDLRRRVANLAQASVVTLTGSGGVGKTRAAVEIGWLVVDEFVDGVWLVELAPVTDPDLAATAVANTLGVRLQPGATMVESIVEWCTGRRMLLILDNCEHLLDAVSEVVQAITARCPTVTILATSREPLGVPGETVLRIPSLDDHFATELFVLRARSANADFEPSDSDTTAISAICTRLDGIPLAIELAAARTRALSPAELLQRLDDRFRLLRSSGRGGLERHQTLRATVAWSYQLLSEPAQQFFDRLSVFAGSFDLDAAEAICTGDGIDALDAVDLLSDLVDKSTIIAEHTDAGTRYRLLETLRQFGEERLHDCGDTAAFRDAHLHHFVAVAQRLRDQHYSAEAARARVRLINDWSNLGAAHAWAVASGDIRSAHDLVRLTWSAAIGSFLHDHSDWCRRTLELAATTGRDDPWTLAIAGVWAALAGDPHRAVALGQRAVAVDETDPPIVGSYTSVVGYVAAGRNEEALRIAAELRPAVPDVSDLELRHLASMAVMLAGDPDRLDDDADAAIAAAREIGSPALIAMQLNAAASRRALVDPDRAIVDVRQAIRLFESHGSSSLTWALFTLSWLLAVNGDPDARTTLHNALARADDERLLIVVDGLLEAAPVVLAANAPDAGAIISGYVAAAQPPWGALGAALRTKADELVDAVPGTAALRARGATMNRDQITALALDALS